MYFIITFISAIGNAIIGAVTLNKNRKNPLNRLFFLFTSLLAIYIIVRYYSFDSENIAFYQSTFIISDLIKAAGITWILALCRGYKKFRTIIIYLTGLLVGIGAFINGLYSNSGPGILIHILFAIAIITYGLYLLIESIIKEKGVIRKKLTIVTFGVTSYAILGLIIGAILPMININIEYLEIPLSLILTSSIAFVMIRYKEK